MIEAQGFSELYKTPLRTVCTTPCEVLTIKQLTIAHFIRKTYIQNRGHSYTEKTKQEYA